MRTWTASGKLKIARAYKHIGDLELRLELFRESRPYRVVHEANGQGGVNGVIRARRAIPTDIAVISADAVHNLNVALDHLWQRAIHGRRSRRKDHFPAYACPEGAKTRFRGKEKGRMKEVVDLLFRSNAFEVGNPFVRIRDFDDADKHDTMMLVACALSDYAITTERVGGSPLPLWTVRQSDTPTALRPVEDGAVLYGVPATTSKVYEDHDLTDFEVTFGEGGVLQREAVLPTLKHLAQAVDGLAAAFTAAGLLD